MSEYEEQARAFLDKTGTALEIEFAKHGYYFDGDNEARDIYQCRLTRGGRSYSFKFGQCTARSVYRHERRVVLGAGRGAKQLHSGYLPEGAIKGMRERHGRPTAYDILACLTKSDPGTFEDFCSSYGYDDDSRSAERTYNAVREEWLNLAALFTEEEMAELQDIQ
jgi:hypothetical protein